MRSDLLLDGKNQSLALAYYTHGNSKTDLVSEQKQIHSVLLKLTIDSPCNYSSYHKYPELFVKSG